MEPEGSLPCSHYHGPYPEPDESSPYHPILFLLILFSHLRLSLPSGLFPSGFPTETLYAFCVSHMHATSPAHLIRNFSIDDTKSLRLISL
jgi:hypothetical protein